MKHRIIIICLLLFFVACDPPLSLGQQAQKQIPIGMPRDQAIKLLIAEAWYYQPCDRQARIEDLFFYGSHTYDQADIVIVVSSLKNGQYKVSAVGGFDEPDAWHAVYSDCIQRDKFK